MYPLEIVVAPPPPPPYAAKFQIRRFVSDAICAISATVFTEAEDGFQESFNNSLLKGTKGNSSFN